jgi:hypothetical protein
MSAWSRSPLAGEELVLSLDALGEWRMAGRGSFRHAGPGTIESEGGPGVLWYPHVELSDFVLRIHWRLSAPDDNSGVCVRIPRLGHDDPDKDWRPASAEGYEIQIDDRGVDPEHRSTGSDHHRTGAIYGRSPVSAHASRPVGEWNTFEIEARGPALRVRLNGVAVCALDDDRPDRRTRGYVGLQAHHPGSRVRFRTLRVWRASEP